MVKKQAFNWAGITDNGDGSFTVDGKAARKRLLKEYHKQGLQVRSRKQSDGTYVLSAIGPSHTKHPSTSRGPARLPVRPRSRYPVRGMPPRGGRIPLRQRRYVPPPPNLGGRGSIGIPNLGIGAKVKNWSESRGKARLEQEKKEKNLRELSEQNKKAFAESEKQDMQNKIVEQRKQARLLEERRELEQGQKSSSSLHESIARADQKAEQRRTDNTIQRQQEQRNIRQEARMNQGGWTGGSTKAQEIPKQKIDMQAARENAATQ